MNVPVKQLQHFTLRFWILTFSVPYSILMSQLSITLKMCTVRQKVLCCNFIHPFPEHTWVQFRSEVRHKQRTVWAQFLTKLSLVLPIHKSKSWGNCCMFKLLWDLLNLIQGNCNYLNYLSSVKNHITYQKRKKEEILLHQEQLFFSGVTGSVG